MPVCLAQEPKMKDGLNQTTSPEVDSSVEYSVAVLGIHSHRSSSSALTSLKGCNGSAMVPLFDCSMKRQATANDQRRISNNYARQQFAENDVEAGRLRQLYFE